MGDFNPFDLFSQFAGGSGAENIFGGVFNNFTNINKNKRQKTQKGNRIYK